MSWPIGEPSYQGRGRRPQHTAGWFVTKTAVWQQQPPTATSLLLCCGCAVLSDCIYRGQFTTWAQVLVTFPYLCNPFSNFIFTFPMLEQCPLSWYYYMTLSGTTIWRCLVLLYDAVWYYYMTLSGTTIWHCLVLLYDAARTQRLRDRHPAARTQRPDAPFSWPIFMVYFGRVVLYWEPPHLHVDSIKMSFLLDPRRCCGLSALLRPFSISHASLHF